jgi:hypothetical protein
METLAKLFGSLLALVYHCFDRIVILGHLPLLTRPENIVHFFRDIHQVNPHQQRSLAAANRRLSPLGGSLCQETPDPQ